MKKDMRENKENLELENNSENSVYLSNISDGWCNVEIGNFNIFNGFVPIGHDTTIGNYNVVMPSCNISGGIKMGDCNFMGVKSVVLQYLKVGNNVRIGAGSVLMRNAKDGFLYIGTPAVKYDL